MHLAAIFHPTEHNVSPDASHRNATLGVQTERWGERNSFHLGRHNRRLMDYHPANEKLGRRLAATLSALVVCVEIATKGLHNLESPPKLNPHSCTVPSR